MAPSGGAVSQWRLVVHLRSYLQRSAPVIETLERELPELINQVASAATIKHINASNNHVNKQYTVNSIASESTLNASIIPPAPPPPPGSPSKNSNDLKNFIHSVNATVTAYIPLVWAQIYSNWLETKPEAAALLEEPVKVKQPMPKWLTKKKSLISKASVDARTRHLVRSLGDHLTDGGRLRKLEDLCEHLTLFPQAKGCAVKCEGISRVLRMLSQTKDAYVTAQAYESLALLGYTSPVKANGIRILSIDGGGVRGLVALEIIRMLEKEAGQPIHELFDYICGVSTGAILTVLLGAHRDDLDHCELLYRDLSTKIFSRTRLQGAKGLVMRSSFYNSEDWNDILIENMGEEMLFETARNPKNPKIGIVATQANTKRIQAYILRNYNLPYKVASHYNGTSHAKLWEAVRASAAAPGYFSEYKIGDTILLDGGLMVNNPTAIAVHEARQLWPDAEFQCVVSVGTGRHEPIETVNETSINWGTRIKTIVNSATDTEGVHTLIHDLLPGNVYFRFNPYLSDEFTLDEIDPERLELMMEDTGLYARKNQHKIKEAAELLTKPKSQLGKVIDWYNLQKQTLNNY